MTALNRKLLRDLWRLRGQVLAIAMVIASGVAVLVMSLGSLESLRDTADAYYERYRFADVFVSLRRAPERLVSRIQAIPGVQAVETRISRLAVLDVEDFEEPVIGRLVSIPERGEPVLNRLALRSGRWVAVERPDEVLIGEAFSEAHGLEPGDRLRAVVNGKRRSLEIVGVALSPEFVYSIGPGALMPDDERFGVLWMGREALAGAFDLEGAFNEVSLSLLRGTPESSVIAELDELLAPYGGLGAYAREDQLSNFFLTNEIDQLANLARILPVIFLSVAAFLTHMVLGRLIAIERPEIGLLKAFGYSNFEVGWLYTKLVLVIAVLGVALGWGLGVWFGQVTTGIYADFYRFPFFFFRPSPAVFAVSAAVSLGAALLGTLRGLDAVVRLPPAEAMRPPAPPLYRRAGLSQVLESRFDQPTRMIFRQILRWPVRSFVTTFGIAMAVGLLVTSMQWQDAIDYLVRTFFYEAQHQDLTVGLVEAQSSEMLRELQRLPGVMAAEPTRLVPARLRAGPRSQREAIQGVPAGAVLSPVYDVRGFAIDPPENGLLLSTKLAELLGVAAGDSVEVAVLEGRRPTARLAVAATFETYIGTPAYMRLDALNELMRERPTANLAALLVDPARERELFRALQRMPEVSAVMLRRAAIGQFRDTMAETMLIFVSFFASFAAMLAFGVTYNSTRIALSERARELATLRVLGLSRFEISYILLGEVGLLVLAGLPIGCGVGAGIAAILAESFETDLYRVPLVIEGSTFGAAMLVTLAATAVSGAIVRARLDRLDLIGVLKTRE